MKDLTLVLLQCNGYCLFPQLPPSAWLRYQFQLFYPVDTGIHTLLPSTRPTNPQLLAPHSLDKDSVETASLIYSGYFITCG